MALRVSLKRAARAPDQSAISNLQSSIFNFRLVRRDDHRLERSAAFRQPGQQRGKILQASALLEEGHGGNGAGGQRVERLEDGGRSVVERAEEGERVVVEASRVERDLGAGGAAAEEIDR